MKFLIILTLIFVLNCCAKASILGSCVYKYDNQNVYTCTINNVTIVNPTDVLEITGIHLENHTDADVHAVNFDKCRINFFNGEVFAKFLNLLQDVIDSGINIVLTAHTQIRKFEQPTLFIFSNVEKIFFISILLFISIIAFSKKLGLL